MSFRLLPLLLLCASLTPLTAAEKTEKKQATAEEIRARLQDHQLKKRTERAAANKATRETAPATSVAKSIEENPPAKQAAEKQPASTAANDKKAAPEDPTVLPQVEVRKDRITETDRQVAKQNKAIARERQNTKPTALDESLNGPKASKWFALFGGQSSEDRANLARERVSMMEDERDLIEAIEQAQTSEEKAQLQRTLDSMRAMRRELESSLR